MKILIIYFLILKLLLTSNILFADYLKGYKEFENENYKLAFQYWLESANQNDTLSQFYLALLYKNGLGIKQDFIKAFELFEKVSEKGMFEGYYNLGLLYYNGLGVEKNFSKALIAFDKAKIKIFESYYYLGVIHSQPDKVYTDFIKA